MKASYINAGPYKLYVFPEGFEGEQSALKLCKAFGYKFYPGANSIGKSITREIFSGHILMTEKLSSDAVCTVASKLYNALSLQGEDITLPNNALIPANTKEKEIKQSIADSKLVFIAGRGIGSKANYERLKELGKKYGAAVGCSRPVAMNGWESYESCVGISGNSLSADLAVCFGVSGSMPFTKGIENCKKIIAINSDKNALIFSSASYGLRADCMDIITYLENK